MQIKFETENKEYLDFYFLSLEFAFLNVQNNKNFIEELLGFFEAENFVHAAKKISQPDTSKFFLYVAENFQKQFNNKKLKITFKI